MALLRASSSALGHELDITGALDRGAGVPNGRLLVEFTEAAQFDRPALAGLRADVEATFGESGLAETCLTIGAFNGLTRVADATGIVLDGGSLAATTDLRAELAINDMAGARNTGRAVYDTGAPVMPIAIAELFSD
ncbi:MAG: hypothetical protein ACRDZZ_11290 [Ilumatobacteraceae bacterium]